MLPQGTNTHLEVRLIAVRMDFKTQRVISSEAASAIIDFNEDVPFNGIALNVPIEGEGTLMVALQCRACKAINGILYPTGDRRYMAADIIHLVVPIEQVLIPDACIAKAPRKRFVFRNPASSIAIPGKGPNRSNGPNGSNGSSPPSLRDPGSPV
jgi:hypothetical protein